MQCPARRDGHDGHYRWRDSRTHFGTGDKGAAMSTQLFVGAALGKLGLGTDGAKTTAQNCKQLALGPMHLPCLQWALDCLNSAVACKQ